MIKIGTIGYNYSHGKEFVMDRPNGPGCWLFLLIKTPALFTINGVLQEVKENSFIIFSPDTPCIYKAQGDIYTDDWFYFGIDEGDEEYFKALEIPINTIVHLGSIDELSHIMHIMTFEHYSADTLLEEIEAGYLNIMFMKISRIIKSKTYVLSSAFVEKNTLLTRLRTRIFNDPDEIGDIDSMANELNMSRSGFQHLYKKLFGTSVISDVISGRLERAKRLLSSTKLTIEEIAVRCGYSSSYCFMRQFKDKVGKTPSEYRNSI